MNGDRAPELKAVVELLLNLMEGKKTDHTIDRFAEVAHRFCAWAEGMLGDPNDEMRLVQLLLAELHLAAVELPDLGIGKNIDAVSIAHDDWSQFFKKFGGLPVNIISMCSIRSRKKNR